jgi:hypothetical protein
MAGRVGGGNGGKGAEDGTMPLDGNEAPELRGKLGKMPKNLGQRTLSKWRHNSRPTGSRTDRRWPNSRFVPQPPTGPSPNGHAARANRGQGGRRAIGVNRSSRAQSELAQADGRNG